MTFATVCTIGRRIRGVEVGRYWGGAALVHHTRLVACMATNKQAEPNTLVVRVAEADRDLLIEEQPDIYYLKEHYEHYSCVLVRLSRIRRDALEGLLAGAAQFVAGQVAAQRVRRGTGARRSSAESTRARKQR
jgi:hypothetical protein